MRTIYDNWDPLFDAVFGDQSTDVVDWREDETPVWSQQ